MRRYQVQACDDLRAAFARGARSVLLQAPTGSGKTRIAAQIAAMAVEKGSRVAMLAPRRELVYQASGALKLAQVRHGMFMAGEARIMFGSAFVGCVPTLYARCVRKSVEPPKADLVIVDEAHLSLAPSVRAVLRLWPDARIVGLTATPSRSDGKPLGDLYDELVQTPGIRELTAMGHLVPLRYFAPTHWDLSGVGVSGGDYKAGELDERVNQTKLVGDVVANWHRIAADRPTVVFAVSIAHSMALCERFRQSGVSAEHIDGRMDVDERAAILERFQTGVTQVLTNCQICTYGWDAPRASAVVLARPTKSVVAYLQMVGRIMRPGKADGIVIDHGGVIDELGFADADRTWSLKGKQGERTQQDREQAKRKFTCGSCGHVFSGTDRCPNCGELLPERQARDINVTDAELEEISRSGKPKEPPPDPVVWLRRFKGYALKKNKSESWVRNAFATKFKAPLPVKLNTLPPLEPTPETMRYVKYLNIRSAKRRVW